MKVLFLLAAFSSFAFAGDVVLYSFGDLKVAFVEVDGLMVNKACADKKCEAYKKGKELGNVQPPADLLVGGKNPRSVRCKEMMGGKVYIGTDKNENEQSFCYFPDKSFLR